jgi:PAS domain S-box-containing protein
LTADNLAQQRRIPVLAALVTQKVQFSSTVIGLRQSKGLEAAADAVKEGQVQRGMNEIAVAIQEMREEELRLLTARGVNAKRHLDQTRIVLILGTILGLSIAVAAGWSVQRENSARELAEQALREGEESFRTLANNIPQLAWMADEKGWIFWYNPRWLDYTCTTLTEMARSGWRKVFHPDHVQRVEDKISRCFQSGEIWEDTFPIRGCDGTYSLFLSRAVPIRDPAGRVLRWFGTNSDIRDSKESGARYRGLLEAAPDAAR